MRKRKMEKEKEKSNSNRYAVRASALIAFLCFGATTLAPPVNLADGHISQIAKAAKSEQGDDETYREITNETPVLSTIAAHSINNDSPSVDFKLTTDEQESVLEKLRYSWLSFYDKDESEKYKNKSSERNIDLSEYYQNSDNDLNKEDLNDAAVAKSWLITHNYLEPKKELKWSGGQMRYLATAYRDASDDWNSTFEDTYSKYLDKVTASNATKTYVKKVFAEYCKKASSNNTWSTSVGTNNVDKQDVNAIKAKITKYKQTLVTKVNKSKSNYQRAEIYSKYMEKVLTLAKNYRPIEHLDDSSIVNKTEMLVLLDKAAYGVKQSRPVVFEQKAYRNGKVYSKTTSNYWDDGDEVSSVTGYWDTYDTPRSAYFENDLYYYVTGNVYELYIKDLLERAIIYKKELGSSQESTQFKKDFKNFAEDQPDWDITKGLSKDTEGCLGSGYEVNGDDGIACKEVSFFKNEEVSRIEALTYVADIVRTLEKNITDTEAAIVTYKFGIDYLSNYSAADQKTLKFLIAKGILNFEDPNSFLELDSAFDYNWLYRIVYRAFNPEVRYDFSQIQLTDSEKAWSDLGYGESTLDMNEIDSAYISDDGEVTVVEDDTEGDAEDTESTQVVASNTASNTQVVAMNAAANTQVVAMNAATNSSAITVGSPADVTDSPGMLAGLASNARTAFLSSVSSIVKPGSFFDSIAGSSSLISKPLTRTLSSLRSTSWYKSLNAPAIAKADGYKTYKVTFKVSQEIEWTYKPTGNASAAGIPIEKIASGEQKVDNVSVSKGSMKYDGKKVNIYIVDITITDSRSASSALNRAKARLQHTGSDGGITTVTKVSEKGTAVNAEEYSMVSAEVFKQEFSNIAVLEDKVLINTETNTQAILFEKAGRALVGNTVISTKDMIITHKNDTTFYNVKVIIALLDNAFIKNAGLDTQIWLTKDKNLTMNKANIETEYDESSAHKVTCPTIKIPLLDGETFKEDSAPAEGEYIKQGQEVFYYKVDDITDGINTVVRDYTVELNGQKKKITLIVDWMFAVPSSTFISSSNITELADTGNLTMSQLTDMLYTRPSNPYLQMWWDSNYAASNALMNFLMDTSSAKASGGVNYVQSGYLTPSMTILIDDTKKNVESDDTTVDSWVSALFSNSSDSGLVFSNYDGLTCEKGGDGSNINMFFGNAAAAAQGGRTAWYTNFYSSQAFSRALDSPDYQANPQYYNLDECLVDKEVDGELKSEVVKISPEDKKLRISYLNSLASLYRKMNIHYLSEVKGNSGDYSGEFFGTHFYRTSAGVLYKNIDEDHRMSYTTKKVDGTKKNSKITVVDQISVDSRSNSKVSIEEGDVVTYKKKKMIYVGMDGDNYVLFPADKSAVRNVNSPLYNGGFLSIRTADSGDGKKKAGEVTFVVDRGSYVEKAWASKLTGCKKSSTGVYSYFGELTSSDSGDNASEVVRYSGWKDLYTSWVNHYFSDTLTDSIGDITLDKAFSTKASILNSAGAKSVASNGTSILYLTFNGGKVIKNINNNTKGKNTKEIRANAVNAAQSAFINLGSTNIEKGEVNGGATASVSTANSNSGIVNQLTFSGNNNNIKGYLNYRPKKIDDKKTSILGNRISFTKATLGKNKYRYGRIGKDENGNYVADTRFFVFAVPNFYIARSDFHFEDNSDGTFTLEKGGDDAALSFGNYYYSGIIRSVQESIIAKEVGTRLLSKLNKGNVVTIAGIRFKVDEKAKSKASGVWLTSVPLNSSGKRASLKNAAISWKPNDKANQEFRGEVTDIFKDTIIRVDGYRFNLVQFIKKYNGGKNKKAREGGIQVGYLTKSKAARRKGMVFYDSVSKENCTYGYKKDKSGKEIKALKDKNKTQKSAKSNYQLTTVRIYLDKNLYVRPLNSARTVFTLTNTGMTGIAGADNDSLWMFGESLNYDDNLYNDVVIDSSRFNPSAAFLQFKKEFNKLYREAWAGDFKSMLIMLVIYFCAYLAIMSWISFIILHYGTFNTVLTLLAEGNKSFNGIDLLAIFTFGIYRLRDREASALRSFTVTMLCFIVIGMAWQLR